VGDFIFYYPDIIRAQSPIIIFSIVSKMRMRKKKTSLKHYSWKQATEFISKFVEIAEPNSYHSQAEVMNLTIILGAF
jgi:hypothetical protein